jgi:hypothetical protein
MTTWTKDELARVGAAQELRIASVRRDGTLRTPRIIWAVRLGDSIYVRSVNGPDAAWYRGTQVRHEGRVWAGGVEKDVTFVDADHGLDGDLDAAYRAKYRHSPAAVSHITSSEARSTTLELVPRSNDS